MAQNDDARYISSTAQNGGARASRETLLAEAFVLLLKLDDAQLALALEAALDRSCEGDRRF